MPPPSESRLRVRRLASIALGLAIATSSLLTFTSRAMRPANMDEAENVDSYLDALVADSKVPGLQYVVVDSTGIVFEYVGGWADLARSRPMGSATTLMAYSMSKTVTAAAVLRLADSGLLDLDDPVSRYVDDLPYGSNVTIRHLLTHTAGIPNPIPLRWAHLTTEHASFDESAALSGRLRDNATLSSQPGERFRYSNLGYWLLGPVVERASSRSFDEYVAAEVLDRIGVAGSRLAYTVDDPSSHAVGYLEKYSLLNLVKRFVLDGKLIGDYEGRWLEINGHYVDGPAFGGLVGNARGFAGFLLDQLQSESALFSNETRQALYQAQELSDGTEAPMTAGWHVADPDGAPYFYKEGGGGGFHSLMRLYKNHGIGTVVLTNATGFDVQRLLDEVDASFLR